VSPLMGLSFFTTLTQRSRAGLRYFAPFGAGARSFEDIARALGKVERQRYYRKAAEILALIRNTNNNSVLTTRGRAFLDNPGERAQRLAEAVLTSRLIQRVVPYLEAKGERGASRSEMERFIGEVTDPVGKSMIPRRAHAVVSWLERIGMVQERGGRISLRGALPAGVKIVEYGEPDEPLFPRKYALDEYRSVAGKVRDAKGYINVLIDDAARERVEDSHRMLMEIVASKMRKAGSIPKNNKYVDLSAVLSDNFYLFEMKSTTDKNVHARIRRAISQLYEYRYLQEVPAAKLVVVIENRPRRRRSGSSIMS
jgi:hypothetical protein